MVAAWGGYVFIINIIPIYVVVMVVAGRYSSRLYIAYSTFYALGSLLAMQVKARGKERGKGGNGKLGKTRETREKQGNTSSESRTEEALFKTGQNLRDYVNARSRLLVPRKILVSRLSRKCVHPERLISPSARCWSLPHSLCLNEAPRNVRRTRDESACQRRRYEQCHLRVFDI